MKIKQRSGRNNGSQGTHTGLATGWFLVCVCVGVGGCVKCSMGFEGVEGSVREKQSVTHSCVCFGQLNGNNNGASPDSKSMGGMLKDPLREREKYICVPSLLKLVKSGKLSQAQGQTETVSPLMKKMQCHVASSVCIYIYIYTYIYVKLCSGPYKVTLLNQTHVFEWYMVSLRTSQLVYVTIWSYVVY